MDKPHIAIIGLRGIPSKYGGTETFVEELTMILKDKFQFYVMHEDDKFFEDNYNGIIRIHSLAIESKSTSIPSINDFLNTAYVLAKHKKSIDLFYFLGPDSAVAAILAKFEKKRIMMNPDGVEWKRLIKRSYFVPFYLFPIYLATMIYMYLMEYLSCKLPDVVVADSLGIREHLMRRHKPRRVIYIAYGARELLPSKPSKEDEAKILDRLRRFS
ncbi:DUF1972 domain-containing protein [Pyrococcus abyssi]|uniref:DUF1972 domain-containing protein n=1 Tax=Pyrococcus abyssi (strain GE5 / Orsay) TaxID=272844 RepID=Q9UZF7_PYRAB|nr:DUF1972 domain-containing protein [Pyrococcus abyssi]CAB50102.1 Hypothetical protein PAB1588 [Pyrococcus abyssi GE5]CCE70622.1 TPA: hypothetical protein PAB1588 [Pyrococcus abyssi GE5]